MRTTTFGNLKIGDRFFLPKDRLGYQKTSTDETKENARCLPFSDWCYVHFSNSQLVEIQENPDVSS